MWPISWTLVDAVWDVGHVMVPDCVWVGPCDDLLLSINVWNELSKHRDSVQPWPRWRRWTRWEGQMSLGYFSSMSPVFQGNSQWKQLMVTSLSSSEDEWVFTLPRAPTQSADKRCLNFFYWKNKLTNNIFFETSEQTVSSLQSLLWNKYWEFFQKRFKKTLFLNQ